MEGLVEGRRESHREATGRPSGRMGLRVLHFRVGVSASQIAGGPSNTAQSRREQRCRYLKPSIHPYSTYLG